MHIAWFRHWMVAAFSLLLLMLSVNAAFAHAQLLTSEPTANAVVMTAPDVAHLTFNEPVNPLVVSLIGPDGVASDLLDGATGGAVVTIALPQGLGDGTHVLSWRVASIDGHPIAGSLVFSIGEATGTPTLAAPSEEGTKIALWGGKLVLFVALFVGVGGAVFASVSGSAISARRGAMLLALAGVIVAPLTLGLQGLDALGLPLTGLVDGKAWAAGLSTSYGATALVATLAFGLAVVALTLRRARVAGALGVLAGLIAALAIALSGHASAAEPQWLTRPAVFLHIAGLLFWIGALLPLWVLLRERSAAADHALARFSQWVPVAVGAIIVSGFTLAVIQLGTPGASWLSPYVLILTLKLVLLAVLFGLAVWNRGWLTSPTLAGDAVARQKLRASIRIEAVLVLLILALVAGWRFTPPPRALAIAAANLPPIMEHVMDDKAMATLTLTPGNAGPVLLELWLTDTNDAPLTPQEVSVTLTEPALGIGPIKLSAVGEGPYWAVEGLTIPVAGTWTIAIDIRASRFELFKLEAELDIP